LPTALRFQPALERTDLISPTIIQLLSNWKGSICAKEVWVSEIDSAHAGGKELCEHYAVSPDEGATCVIVEALRGTTRTLAACVAPVNYRIDFNGKVRKFLNARRVFLAPLEEILHESKMEYGSITPIGLPEHWPILLDEKVTNSPRIIIGAGKINAKLSLPGKLLSELQNASIINGLGIKLEH